MYIKPEDIDRLFTYRKWSEAEVLAYRPLREKAKALAHEINNTVPDGPHKTRAINALHECVYLFNTSVSVVNHMGDT